MIDWSKTLSLSALRAFHAAAELGSFSQAARALNVTHAAVAQHVRNLESELSQPLMMREGRGVKPTPVGRELAEQLGVGFGTIAAGIRDAREKMLTAPVSLTLTPAFAEKWLMPRLTDFWAKYPEVSLNIQPSFELVNLAEEGFDLAIRYGAGNWPKLEARLLSDGDFWVVAHPKLLAGRTPRCVQDVLDLPWVMEAHMMTQTGILCQQGVDLATLDMTEFNTSGLVQSAVNAGMGLTVQPKSIVEGQVEKGELVKICSLRHLNYGYYVVTRKDRQLSDPAKAFVDWLQAAQQS